MNEERFREDLFHRLSSVVVRTPPLRERREDISLICDREIMAIDFELRPQVKERFDEFLARNGDYAWPGNVRELKKVLRALAVGSSPETRGSGPARPAGGLPAQIAEGMMTMERARAWYAGHVLSRFQGNMSRAAKALDIDRATLRKLLPEKSHAS